MFSTFRLIHKHRLCLGTIALIALTTGLTIYYHFHLALLSTTLESASEETFQAQVLQVIDHLSKEVETGKTHLDHLRTQMHSLLDSMAEQTQRWRSEIEETRERFTSDYPPDSELSSSDHDNRT